MAEDALTTIANELYALPPADFTAARNARAAEVKTTDRDLAERIRGLKKPTPAAWLVNQLARQRADTLGAVLDLGDQLRDAQDRRDRPELTRLIDERRASVRELVGDAAALAQELGHPVAGSGLDEVERTLNAATSDEAATDAVLSGRLLRALVSVGFDPVDLDGAVAGGAAAPRPAGRPVADLSAHREHKRLEQAASSAERAAASARRTLDTATARRAEGHRRLREASADRDDAVQRLQAAETLFARAEAEQDRLEQELRAATAVLEQAEAAAAAARAEADALS